MVKTQIVQKFFENIEHGKKELKKMSKDPHSHWARDYGDHTVTKIKLAKTGLYGKANKRSSGRKLYDIYVRQKKVGFNNGKF